MSTPRVVNCKLLELVEGETLNTYLVPLRATEPGPDDILLLSVSQRALEIDEAGRFTEPLGELRREIRSALDGWFARRVTAECSGTLHDVVVQAPAPRPALRLVRADATSVQANPFPEAPEFES